MSDDMICVGAIGGAYGVRGEVRVKSFCAVAEDIETYRPLTSEDGSQTFHLAILRPIKNGFAARIAEVATKANELHSRLTISHRANLLRSAVARAVVDEHDFEAATEPVEHLTDLVRQLLHRARFVEHRHEDADLHCLRRGGRARILFGHEAHLE